MAKILVVDDELLLRELLQEILCAGGHAVETAEDGRAGLDKLREGGFELMISDVNMPVLSGLELLRLVRRDPAFQALPVLVCTARGKMGEVDAAFEAGATGYIIKPFQAAAVLEKVSKGLKKM